MPVRIPREYREFETAYLVEFLQAFYPDREYYIGFRLGRTLLIWEHPELPEEELRLFRGYLPEVDAVVFGDNMATLLEAKILPKFYRTAIGALEDYRELVPFTPEFAERGIKQFEFLLVTPLKSTYIMKRCLERGFRNVIFYVPLVEDVFRRYRPVYREIPRYQELLEKYGIER